MCPRIEMLWPLLAAITFLFVATFYSIRPQLFYRNGIFKKLYRDNDDYIDANPAFHVYTDIDFELESGGVKRASFVVRVAKLKLKIKIPNIF